MALELNEDPSSTIGATEEYKAAWHEKYGKDEPDAVDTDSIELDESPDSTIGATEEYKTAWHEKYGNSEPAGNAAKSEWVDYAVKQGAPAEDAEAMTATELKETYGGMGIVSAPAQGSSFTTTADADAASGDAAPGGGVNSGTAEGTATTTGTSSAGARAKS